MIEVLAVVVALLSLGASAALALKVRVLSERLDMAQRKLESGEPNPSLLELPEPSPIEGLRVVVVVTQDHAHPVFANLLKEHLLREDVTDVDLVTADQWGEKVEPGEGRDILIIGELTCNGYAEIYYSADFTCYSAQGAVCTLVERPPHGDRPGNLAIELVAKLKKEIGKMIQQSERRSAIRELREPL